MKTFVVYEIWTCARVVQAESEDAALEDGPHGPQTAPSLANWYAVEVPTAEAKEEP